MPGNWHTSAQPEYAKFYVAKLFTKNGDGNIVHMHFFRVRYENQDLPVEA